MAACRFFLAVFITGIWSKGLAQTVFRPLTIIANEGESAVFACSPFLGGSTPVLEIQRPGESSFTTVQTDDPRLSFQDFPSPNVPTNRTYTYSNVQRSEHGTLFTCNVNSIGAPDPGTLTVNFPPTYADPGVQIVEEGQDITVTLTVLESRPTDLTVGTLTRAGGASVPGDTAFNTVCVTFIDVQCGDAGQYTLTSSNVAGAGSVTFTLDVQRNAHDPCSLVDNCSGCIRIPQCVWCLDVDLSPYITSRCQTGPTIAGCNSVENPTGSITGQRNAENLSIEPVNPRAINVSLRAGVPQNFTVNVTALRNLPLDLYLLMDLSGSMLADLTEVKAVSGQIVDSISSITTNVRLGFGSFNEKVTRPFAAFNEDDPPDQCDLDGFECPPYAFRHQISLTDDVDDFQARIQPINVTFNVDDPENGLEAMAQVITCEDIIGWRSRTGLGDNRGLTRVILYITDDHFHYAGEGQLAGILEPYVGTCLLEPPDMPGDTVDFTAWNRVDYPSVGQIALLTQQYEVAPIFVARENFQETYETLAALINRNYQATSAVNTEDSSNITSLIRDEIAAILQTISLEPSVSNEFSISTSVGATCPDDAIEVAGTCQNVPLDETASFEVTVTLDSCYNQETGELLEGPIAIPVIVPSLGGFTMYITALCTCDGETESVEVSNEPENVPTVNLNNIDVREPIVRRSPATGQDVDLFGYSVAAHQIQTLDPGLTDPDAIMQDALGKTRIIIGAPKGTYPGGLDLADPGLPASIQSGLVFSCPISPGLCEGVTGDPATFDLPEVTVDDDDGVGEGRLFDHRPAAQVPPRPGLTPREFENKTGQLLGASVLSTGENVLVCAPRWSELITLGPLPLGRCYITDRDLTNVRPLQPCSSLGGGPIEAVGQGYCTAGAGAVITDDLIAIGAPGFDLLKGVLWYYEYNSGSLGTGLNLGQNPVLGNFSVPDSTGTLVEVNDIYTGYRVISGYITSPRGAGNRADIIATVPRYNQTAGKYGRVNVYGVPSPPTSDADMLLMATAEGEQIGEFFGYSMIATDLDGDDYDDLVVGAPMYTGIPRGKVESGRVYIFNNLQNGSLSSTPIIVEGDVARGRFGSSLTNLGDVDNDGYEDIAIGAPYAVTGTGTNTGTVFIYYGRSDISQVAEQKPFEITADRMVSRVNGLNELKTFGWSLSGGVDVDANQYNDLVIGAYESQTVVVLRSIPVADVYVELVATSRLNLEGSEVCTYVGDITNYPCFSLTIRENYTGKGLDGALTVNYTLTEVISNEQRLFFDLPDMPNQFSGEITFSDTGVATEEMLNVLVFRLDDISSLDTLVLDFQVQQIYQSESMGDGNQTITSLRGVPRVRQLGDTQLQVRLVTNCSDICDADLTLTVITFVFQNRDLSGIVDQFVAGMVGAVDITLSYLNNATEVAIDNMLKFNIPSIFNENVISTASCTSSGNCSTQCQLQDLLTKGNGDQNVTIRLIVNQDALVGNEEIEIALTLCTLGSRDNFTENNMGTVSISVTVFCDAELLDFIQWPTSEAGSEALVECPFGPTVPNGMARRVCGVDGTWRAPQVDECNPVFCLPEIDMEWNLSWNVAAGDSTVANQCPNNGEGTATRYCYPHGVWDPVNVLNCTSMGFNFLRQQAEVLNETSTASNQEKLGRVESIIVALLNKTGPTSNTRLFPQDLETTTKLLNSIVDFYAVTLEEITNTGCIENLIDVINNVLNQIYVDEWQELEAVSERQILLSNIEQFGRLIANATVQTVDRNQTSLVRSNIVLNARVQDLHDEQDIVFPVTGSPFSTEAQFDFPRAQISIPPSVISESQPVIAHFFIDALATIIHDVSGNLYVDDLQTLTIENFNYDGFSVAPVPYYYERGVAPLSSGGGFIIPVSTQSDEFNRAYTDETVVLSLPAGVTICDIGFFTVRDSGFSVFLANAEFPEILPGCRVSLVTTVMNIQDILPAFENNAGRNIRTVAASMALSTQIGNGSPLTLNTPVQLGFTTEAIEGGFNPRCVFWDFSQEAWSTSGVQTSSVATQSDGEFNTFSVVCETNHFTTFVVLVDVTEAFCSCVPMPIGGMVFPTCGDAGTDACECTETGCTCQLPFIGDGEACTFDRDSDGIPDRPLPTCTEQQENQNYCKEDNCTFDFNPDQDSRACEAIVEEGFDGCLAEVDEVWNIQWNDTFSGVYDTQPCPEDRIGLAIRLCNTDRDWESVNVLACQSQDFTELSQEIEDVLDETSGQTTAETTEAVAMITEELADATNTIDETTPLYPQEITITTDIVDDVVTFLLNTVDEPTTESDTALQLNSELIQVFDNILDESNADSWMQLEDAEDTGSVTLLMNAEEYGLYVAAALASNTTDTGNSSEIPLSGSFGNIVLEATLQETDELNDVFFPVREETFTTEPQFQERLAQIKIPAQLLRERADQDDATRVSTINIVMMNIQEFLPNNFIEAQISQSNDSNATVTTVPATMVLSSQIVTDASSIPQTLNTTAQLVFTTNPIQRGFNARCAFWNFTEGAWDTSGVDTVSVRNQSENDLNTFHVVCETQHLTSFCVLVDITGEIFNPIEAFALELISFIGCGVSMFFLLLAILFFLSYGKQLFTSVHYFIHLNLAIALFLGYLTFVSGIETAVNSKIACKFVSALLHYLFLSVFCWMLCEGIMIYLLLVVVFSKISKQWWIFFLIGWGIPLVIVSIAVGIAHKQYAPEGQEYCWISVEKGAIWAFVGPMLAVICINIIFWILALRNLYKVQAAKREQHVNKTRTFLARKLMLAALTLLPLLGLTWLFGLLSVNNSTTVFSWLFTILNSTQGVFIFIFHVLRTDKVQKKLEKWIPCLKKSKLDRTKSQVSKSTSGYQRRRVKTKKQNYSDSSALCSDAVIVFEDPDIALSGKRRKGSDEIGLTTRTWIA